MRAFWLFWAFVYGTLAGSYLNMLVYRRRRGMSAWIPARSFCDSCGKTLGFLELVPVLGWLAFRGRSRCCGERISPVYPLVELGTGLVFAGVAGFVLR
ncbi:prepilin signal peptidase PulO-like enzyme (type II secretory pathway) [Desulfofundulus luciae]|uniref:Prepilin signal peptidase PulO-like enzyme (Type II secretory pathway) n=1 Tax=Desulfofundulus luciae TaxID=74702 RepID=A0ABU0B452_9FIRM|nr:prepilin peptidase [Desulfofundulus luciae]MDQ0287501.1 prepilin signal peptidase PulO-like enzyme (type II secretory pathway) [Desulfofundulus luciae]